MCSSSQARIDLTNWLINTRPAEITMKAAVTKPRLGSRGRPEESRAAILQAAVREFSREGVAGARTDAIARAAGVNKALLYYYYKDKETLYGAVLDHVFGGLSDSIQAERFPAICRRAKSCWLTWARTLTTLPVMRCIPRITQSEMMRAAQR